MSMRNYQTSRQVTRSVLMIFFVILSLIVVYPLVYLVSASFSPGNSIADMDIKPFARGITLEHFRHIFLETDFNVWLLNTLHIAVVTTVASLLITALSAYVFSRFTFPFKKPMLLSLLILQIFPSFVGMIAVYVILQRVGGYDHLWGLELVYIAGNIPYNTWMVKSYLDTVPKSLDEAARIDGAGHFRIWWQIVMPVARPIMIVLGITSFTGPWMDYIFPKMVLRSPEKQTIALGLISLVSDKKNDFTSFSAGALLIAIPFVFFFIFTQKAMMMSMGAAAVKE